MKKNYTILAIDTSCDETSVAITQDNRVLSNIVASQVAFHSEHGGVVPSIAKRKHHEFIKPTITKALQVARIKSLEDLDALAVTLGPGLAPALEVGIATIKELHAQRKLPVIAVNHMEGHLLSSFVANRNGKSPLSPTDPPLPILGLLISGGHTQLILMHEFGVYSLVGETLDDAIGEAFDKVSKMLDLGYPGGPIISDLAKQGKPLYPLPVPMRKDTEGCDFSYSGLKTACLYAIRDLQEKDPYLLHTKQFFQNFAASFEKAAIEGLTIKLNTAIQKYAPHHIVMGGGVVNNLLARKQTRKVAARHGLKASIPYTSKLFTDNAAMIGVCAWLQAQRSDFVANVETLDRKPNYSFSDQGVYSAKKSRI